MVEVRWHGRGGQGSFTVARLLGLSASLFENKYALAFPSFGPERRGAPVLGFTKIDTQKIHDRSEVTACDYVVFLDETLLNAQTVKGIKKEGVILVNTKNPGKYASLLSDFRTVAIDATGLALEILKRPITNTAMLGALVAVSNIVTLESAALGIEHEMSPNIAPKNVQLLKKAYETIKERRA